MSRIKDILDSNDPKQLKALFSFDSSNSNEQVIVKFNLWVRKLHGKYIKVDDAEFHREMDLYNLMAYRSEIDQFVDVAYRGAAKTARTKLFFAFFIQNDMDHFRKYNRILSEDIGNATQSVTDIYNILISERSMEIYPEVFQKTNAKREETMSSFTTSTGVKLLAKQIGVDQRGNIQEEAKAEFDWYDDIETRTVLRSARKLKVIWENAEEARTGLAKKGASIYTLNYISERGNVHTLVTKNPPGTEILSLYAKKYGKRKVVMIVPIQLPDGRITWPANYTLEDIEKMKHDDDDFEGERMCKPSASKDVLFDRETLEKQVPKIPIRISAGFKIFKKFDASHRYGSGHDVAGGLGFDSSTSVYMDFSTPVAQVVATFADNTIKPDVFGDEISREGEIFGNPITGIEKNNHGHATIARARQLEVNLYRTEKPKEDKIDQSATATEYGWNTNALTKPKMLFEFAKAVEDGLVELNDEALISECKSYSRDDLLDDENDPRMTTRHFDLLIAACVCWQMRNSATVMKKVEEDYLEEAEELLYPSIGM